MTAEREALRQKMLLRALWRDGDPTQLQGWMKGGAARVQRGLAVYAANAGAAAERALAAQFPTVAALVGEESFAKLARAYWFAWPPQRGDLAWLGEHLSEFIAASPQLRDEPYLADTARLDALLDAAERAADAQPEPETLALLAEHEPERLHLELMPGTAVLASDWPVVAIHAAHRSDAADRYLPVRAALEARRGETALVWREGLRARVAALDADAARFTSAALQGQPLARALESAGEAFGFEPWLIDTLRSGRLRRVRVDP